MFSKLFCRGPAPISTMRPFRSRRVRRHGMERLKHRRSHDGADAQAPCYTEEFEPWSLLQSCFSGSHPALRDGVDLTPTKRQRTAGSSGWRRQIRVGLPEGDAGPELASGGSSLSPCSFESPTSTEKFDCGSMQQPSLARKERESIKTPERLPTAQYTDSIKAPTPPPCNPICYGFFSPKNTPPTSPSFPTCLALSLKPHEQRQVRAQSEGPDLDDLLQEAIAQGSVVLVNGC
jgi:hypothetical protein